MKPFFSPPRPVPYSIREKVEKELARLEEQGIIEPVRFATWVAPLVPAMKKDGSIRVCGDYKRIIKKLQWLIATRYPTLKICLRPSLEEPFSRRNWQWLTRTKGCTATTAYHLVYPQYLQYSSAPWNRYSRVYQMCASTSMTYWWPDHPKKPTSKTLTPS